ncbi:Membrane magnesium transporter 1 [Blyttiomyces sp. JEL0837]|nr:Membrane magnesium transporter 1 [Blyttiomyces sp. JEL0837]
MAITVTILVGQLTTLLGLILLVHSGYSAVEHLSYLKIVGKTEKSLPSDIVIECLLSVLICIVGSVLMAGTFKEISLKKEVALRTMDSLDYRPGFRTLHHRGRVIFSNASKQ